MHNKKILLLFTIVGIISLFPFATLPAQDYSFYFKHINGENGLSESNVKSILQDSYGFMWFGTKNGLNRYDGSSIVQFNCNDLQDGTGNHNISALFEDPDKNLWVGTDRGVYLYNPREDYFTHFTLESDDGIGINNWIARILSDSMGNIWILAPNQGVFRYKEKKLRHYSFVDKENKKKNSPECICTNGNGELWIGTSGNGLFKYNYLKDSFEQHLTDASGHNLAGKNIMNIQFQGEHIIIGVHEGYLLKYNTRTNELSDIHFEGEKKTFLRDIMCVGDDIWMGTLHGIYIINEKKKSAIHLKEDLMRTFSLSDNSIYSLYRDHQGGIWVGTMFGGVNYLSNSKFKFEKYVPGSDSHSLNTKRIRGLAEDINGMIWIGTEDNGVNMLNPRNGMVHQISGQSQEHLITLCMRSYGNHVYAGLFKEGMNDISIPNENLQNIRTSLLGMEEGSVYDLLIDSKGQKWIATGWGLYMKRPSDKQYHKMKFIKDSWVFDILEAKDGTLWFATMGSGIWKYNPKSGENRNYTTEKDRTLRSNSVSAIMQDSKGRIWLSTDRGGISLYHADKDCFTSYSIEEGLPDDVAYNILEDKNGNLWFGTNKGLVRFNPETQDIRTFTSNEGLLGNQFAYKSALKTHDGKFYFGGVNGLISFYPEKQEDEKALPPIYITKFNIYDKEVTIHSPHSPLKQSIIHTQQITLPYNQASISFDVALLNYSTVESNQYYYQMLPLDHKWIKAASNQNISYAQLPPGEYTLRVKAIYADKFDTPIRELSITILPPWWKSVWAYMIYGILIVCGVIGAFLWYRRRKERQFENRKMLFEIEKEKELYESKVEFFTVIAHEVRTPLTLINAPLEAIEEMNIQEPKMKKYIDVMAQNTKRLLDLTGQLLDFQKIDAKKMTLKFENVNIVDLLRETIERFEVAFNLKQKELVFHTQETMIQASVDKEAITKIISNLLNNALKYANKKTSVELERDETNFTIRVSSDGEKISPEIGQYIFNPFYQAENAQVKKRNGVGIGLSLTRSLATLHKGSIYLDTEQDTNVFVVTIPINREGIKQENDKIMQSEIVELEEGNETSSETKGYTLLIVEDNESMLDFIASRLKEYFIVETATNGKEALDLLNHSHIDLIVSDVMMPVMDGFELCKTVKRDVTLSHIPIILLTAKNDINSKINGLKYGAEAYVEKPFSFHFLKEQIKSLLENRRREREVFAKRPFFSIDNMQMNKSDEEFMNQIIHIIEENIGNADFKIEQIAESFCMSPSTLRRKIRALFDLNPKDFVRVVRLKKAAELIQTRQYSLSEVTEKVGINSPSYFAKLFQQQFGLSPKDFEKQCLSQQKDVCKEKIQTPKQ